MFRIFELIRYTDVSGISGTGCVAIGAQHLESGCVAMMWVGAGPRSVAFYNSIEDVLAIHGHQGNTDVCWRHDVFS